MTSSSSKASSKASDVPADIATRPEQAPVQPKLNFPTTLKGNKHCSFRSEWYRSYCCLEYSREKDTAYCYACRLFNVEPGKYWETFTKNGFRDWKHAMGKDGIISCHDNYKTHKEAMVSWHGYVKNTENGTTVDKRLDASIAKIISNNRHYLKAIIEVLLLCSQQEIAL